MKLIEEKVVFDNGIRLILEPYDMVRSVCIGVWVNAGAVFENNKNNGVSHFLEHLLFKGTKNRSSFDIAESIDAVGGQINAFSSKEFTCYFIKVRDEHWRLSLDVLSDMIKNSKFVEEEIEKERNVIIEEIKMYEDAPDEIIHDIFTQSLFDKYPIGYPILGTRDIINNISRDAIVDYYSKMYTGPNIVITMSGKFDPSEVKSFVTDNFSDIAKGNGETPSIEKPQPNYSLTIKKKDIEQVHMIAGTMCAPEMDDERYKLSILSTILGGGMSSRLFQEIREERGLAYSIFSYTNRFRNAGLFAIYAGCADYEATNVFELVMQELNKVKNKPITKKELLRAKEQMKGNIILGLESTNARMNRLGRNEIYFKKQIPVDEIIQKIELVTQEDLMEIAAKYFNRDTLALTLIGPIENENEFKNKLNNFDN